MTTDAIEKLASIAARRDTAEGGHRHGAWGAAFVHWAATMGLEHGNCAARPDNEDFIAGRADAPAILCPIHGRLEGPEVPK